MTLDKNPRWTKAPIGGISVVMSGRTPVDLMETLGWALRSGHRMPWSSQNKRNAATSDQGLLVSIR